MLARKKLPDMSGYTSKRVFSGVKPLSPATQKIIARRAQSKNSAPLKQARAVSDGMYACAAAYCLSYDDSSD